MSKFGELEWVDGWVDEGYYTICFFFPQDQETLDRMAYTDSFEHRNIAHSLCLTRMALSLSLLLYWVPSFLWVYVPLRQTGGKSPVCA